MGPSSTLDSCLLEKFRKKGEKRKKTHREHVEVKLSIQHIFDGRLPATALLDLKGPSSAKAGIKKHSHTSNSNQSLLFLTAVKAFMLTRHRDQSFIHAFKRDWPVNEHVCVPAPDNTPYLCQHTLSLLLILPVILCVTPPTMHKLSAIPTYNVHASVFLCMYVCMRAGMLHLRFVGSDVSLLLSNQLEVAISSPWKPVWGSNWQIDLHDFD